MFWHALTRQEEKPLVFGSATSKAFTGVIMLTTGFTCSTEGGMTSEMTFHYRSKGCRLIWGPHNKVSRNIENKKPSKR